MEVFSCLLIFALSLCSVGAEAPVPSVSICSEEYKNSFSSGCPMVSRIGLGTLHLGDSISGLTNASAINEWILAAVDLGVTLFDLADVYPVKGGDAGQSAHLFGEALAMTPGLRDKLTLVTKMDIIFPSSIDTSREHLTSTLSWYLQELNTDHVDILLLHYPDSYMNATSVAELFLEFFNDGKVRHFGVSNHYPAHFEVLQAKLDTISQGKIRLVTNEIELSVWNPGYMNYNKGLVDHAYKTGYRNLGWGALGGDPIGGLNRLFVRKGSRQLKILRALRQVGETWAQQQQRGGGLQLPVPQAIQVAATESSGGDMVDPAVVALAWLLSHPSGVVPLLGTTNLERLRMYATTALPYTQFMTPEQWWSIAGAGGLCALADTQCDYEEYRA
mmetsp:Transcript_21305/g.36066  ORF Transcript_21305/g.36066 Transcript_21305/m.36066 type:complete len:388 (+) Transcript_21305:81-1244(+)